MATAAKTTPKATTRTTKQRAASAKQTATRRRAASTRAKASQASAPAESAPKTPLERAVAAAEDARKQVQRAVVVQVGAVLEARDTVTGAVEEIQTRYGSAQAAEKQVKRFEKRGEKARKQAERRIKRSRTRVERELKTRRTKAERRVRAERKRVEKEARTAVKRANTRADEVREAIRSIDLANGTGFIQSQVGQVGQVVQTGTSAVRRVTERISA